MTMLTHNFGAGSQETSSESNQVLDPIVELLRLHAKDLVRAALEAEVAQVLSDLNQGRDASVVIRNGYLPERLVTTPVGNVSVKVPRIRSKDGSGVNFASTLIPKYLRRSKSIDAWVAYAYLKGISEGDMSRVLEVVLGEGASGITPSVVSSLKKTWSSEFSDWKRRDLKGKVFTYIYADGIYQEIRGDNPKVCLLVIIGVDEAGKKHLLALTDGVRESTQSWKEVLLDLAARGLCSPKLAIGDGAMGFWAAMSEVFPYCAHQRCWMHKSKNILNYLPKTLHPKAKEDIKQIWMAQSKADAHTAIALFGSKYESKYPKALQTLVRDQTSLLAFYDFPAEHWSHIRTTNAIESTFATLRHRTIKVKGAFSTQTAISMMYRLVQEASASWRRITAHERLGEIISGVVFIDGEPELRAIAS